MNLFTDSKKSVKHCGCHKILTILDFDFSKKEFQTTWTRMYCGYHLKLVMSGEAEKKKQQLARIPFIALAFDKMYKRLCECWKTEYFFSRKNNFFNSKEYLEFEKQKMKEWFDLFVKVYKIDVTFQEFTEYIYKVSRKRFELSLE